MKIIVATILILIPIVFLSGFKLLNVISGSMEPTIKQGSFVIIRNSTIYKTGDIITFNTTIGIITHRIVKIELEHDNYRVFTKGDGNSELDPSPIKLTDILGKVVVIFPSFVNLKSIASPIILPITFYIPAGLLFGTMLKKLK